MSPLQVTEIEYNPSGLSRFLLSDKQHKMWSVVSNDALQTFQTQFPEFADSSVHRLCGGIILPTRFQLNFHPNLGEFLMQIQQFEYKGGAGNNEFANPIFHGSDVELQSFITRFRQIDVSHLIDRDQHAAQTSNYQAATPTPHPFVVSVKESIRSIQADAQNPHLESESEVPPEQAAVLDAIDDGFKPKITTASHSTGKDDMNMSQVGGIGYSQLDGSASQNYFFSQEFDAEFEDTRHDFSQRDENKRNSNANIAAAPASSVSTPAPAAASSIATTGAPLAFSATHLFLSNHARSERALQVGGTSAPPPMNKNQAFVAAFGGVAVSTSFAVKPPFSSTATDTAATATKPEAATSTSTNPSESSKPSTSDKSTLQSVGVSPPPTSSSPSASPSRRQLRSSKGESKSSSPKPSPTRSSQRHSQPPPLSPAVHRSQAQSLSASLSPSKNLPSSLSLAPPQEATQHNLMPSSLDDVINATSQRSQQNAEAKDNAAGHLSDSDSDAADCIAEQENEFPFLTQAGGGSLDEEAAAQDDEQEQPQTQESEPRRSSTRAKATTPPRASPKKTEAPSKAAATGSSVSYDASSIQARQAERKRKLQEEIAAEAEAKRKVEEEARKKKEEAEAAAAAAEARRDEELRKQLALIEAEKKAQAEAIELARKQAAAAAVAASTAQQSQFRQSFIQPLTQSAEAMSDDEICLLTEQLTEGSPQKRLRIEEQKSQRPALNYTQSTSAVVSQSKKAVAISRLSGPRSTAVPAAVEESVRRALEAVEAAQSSSYAAVATSRDTRAKRRDGSHYPPLSFSLVEPPSNKSKPTAADRNKTNAEEKGSASITTQLAVPPSAAIAPATSTTSLPPFGSLFAISSRQVQAALRFFRAKKQRRTFQPNDEEGEALEEEKSNEDDDEDEEMEPGEVQYSQWY